MIRIVHLSDLHMGNRILEYSPPLFDGVAATDEDALTQLSLLANRNSNMPDPLVCVVSGDLSAVGGEGAIRAALDYCVRTVTLKLHSKPIGLEYGDASVNAIPGNHDIWGGSYPPLAWVKFKSRAFVRKMLNLENPPERWTLSGGPFCDVGSLRVRGYLLDSTTASLWNVLARGRISSTGQLKPLQEKVELDEVEDRKAGIQKVLRIAVMHHPIYNKYHIVQMIMDNAGEVHELLHSLQFGLVLCGHEHVFDVHPLGQDMFQLNAGSACQISGNPADTNSFALIEIDDLGSRPNHCRASISQCMRRAAPSENSARLPHKNLTYELRQLSPARQSG